jgi:signal transduction histidine kinase
MRQRPRRTLQHILVIRVLAVSGLACVALIAFVILSYTLDKTLLRELTLRNEVARIAVALRQHENPAEWSDFKDYPNAYGLRIFDHRTTKRRRLIAEANVHLLPPPEGLGDDGADIGLRQGFGAIDDPDGQQMKDRWVFIGHEDVGQLSYWIQVVMVGDPGWWWQRVLEHEMRDHVLVPVLFIVPALAGVMLLTTGIALRPLSRVAAQAAALGRAVSVGGTLTPLSEDNLPQEIGSVVAAINAMLRNLERSFRIQSQFTSDAAHELRTPLAVLLLEVSRLPESPIRETIIHDLRMLAAMVNQLLRFAQAEDVMTRERQAVDITAVARRVCEDLGGIAVKTGIALAFDAPAQPVTLNGNAALIDIAIRNVLDNAIRFSPKGETVVIEIDRHGTVTIDDRGPGIPDQHKDLIFDRLWRHGGGGGSGVGIGLALVRRVTRLHEGDASVEDRPGGGSRFVLTFRSMPQPDMARVPIPARQTA